MVNTFELKLDNIIKKQKEIYVKEINEFEIIGNNFVDGLITSNEFKAFSGGMGVYAQKGGERFMLRLRVLSGILDFKTLKLINNIVNEHNLESIHFTTREAIQLHDLKFHQVISIMKTCLENDLFTRGGGGNFPRNVSTSPLSGVEIDEAFDVAPYSLLVNKYFISKMNSYKLPRKFKVAFSNNKNDTAKASIADLGFLAINQDGQQYFKVFIGGSLGNEGSPSVAYDKLISPTEIFYHVEACLKLFIQEGDYENKSKARMRFIVKRLGEVEFLNRYIQILEEIKLTQNLDIELFEISNFASQNLDIEDNSANSQINLINQKQKSLYTVIVHPKGGILKNTDLSKLTDYLSNLHNGNLEMRLSMEENLYIRNLSLSQAYELLDLSNHFNSHTMLNKSVSCIGVPTCQIGIGESQKLLDSIQHYFKVNNIEDDILPAIHISGCINSCSRHQISEIGFHCKKKGTECTEEIYSLHIGGVVSKEKAQLATVYGDLYSKDIPVFLFQLALKLKEKQLELLDYICRFEDEFLKILNNYLVEI